MLVILVELSVVLKRLHQYMLKRALPGVNVYPSGLVRVSHGSVISASIIGFLHISSQLTPCCLRLSVYRRKKLKEHVIENAMSNNKIVL